MSIAPHLCWDWPVITTDSICRMRCWGNNWLGEDSLWTIRAPRRVLSVPYHATSLALRDSQSQPFSGGPRRNSNSSLLPPGGRAVVALPTHLDSACPLQDSLPHPNPVPVSKLGGNRSCFPLAILNPRPPTPPHPTPAPTPAG